MPTLTLRKLGVSYAIEGLRASGLDAGRLHRALAGAVGPAVAVMSPQLSPGDGEGDVPAIDALIVDRRAEGWDELRARLEAWVKAEGWSFTSWADGWPAEAPSTLHFHR
jgi:hypothetical protein